ncbi:hypothetical protein BJV77DRAFT_1150934 [Russula vinacea]|nr:hypothetical protein BJV77DRAFT_1150934 [Russula vinacea]
MTCTEVTGGVGRRTGYGALGRSWGGLCVLRSKTLPAVRYYSRLCCCSAYARSDARRPPPIRIRLDLALSALARLFLAALPGARPPVDSELLLWWGFVWCIPGVSARIWFGSGIPPTLSVVGVRSTLSPPLRFSGSPVLRSGRNTCTAGAAAYQRVDASNGWLGCIPNWERFSHTNDASNGWRGCIPNWDAFGHTRLEVPLVTGFCSGVGTEVALGLL